ncbi:hypothetical protein M5D96_003288 [Drosophila gunungcola]|uniref:Uncharacterized protein n=1 Tax=Drosophila gunungcola TaxID=103775 RepID=A0A9Q0BS81_9MUSC|nr:hypothetical protein M5D96_003288 [Drosophila gunungcola]
MEMGFGPGSEGFEEADNEKSKAMENVPLSPFLRFSGSGAASQRLAVHRMTPTLEKSHLGGSSITITSPSHIHIHIHNPGIWGAGAGGISSRDFD